MSVGARRGRRAASAQSGGGGGGGGDPVELTLETSGGVSTSTTIVTGSWTPAAGRTYLVCATSWTSGAAVLTPSSGNGLSFTEVAYASGASDIVAAMWLATAASPSTGTVTITSNKALTSGDVSVFLIDPTGTPAESDVDEQAGANSGSTFTRTAHDATELDVLLYATKGTAFTVAGDVTMVSMHTASGPTEVHASDGDQDAGDTTVSHSFRHKAGVMLRLGVT